MSHADDQGTFSPENFSGVVRLFPLPNLVLFPHVVQPLHIFEPRYVDMLQAALASDRLIALALLKPGWEQDYEGRPPIAEVACLARVITCQTLPDNRFNLLVMGLRRVLVTSELPPSKSFREAQVELLEDQYPDDAADARAALHHKLAGALEQLLPNIDQAGELFGKLSIDTISLGALCDVVGYAIDANVLTKQGLLNEANVERRAERLLEVLKSAGSESRPPDRTVDFPPAFSAN